MSPRAGRHVAGVPFLIWILASCSSAPPPETDPVLERLVTRAEATDYAETTSFDDVVSFLEAVDEIHTRTAEPDRFHLTTFGQTNEGRRLPLMVVGDLSDSRPASVRGAGRLTVWLQATIHGGEVCGKEALLMLLRSLAAGERPGWTSDLVLLIAPVYNADGNDTMALDNRPLQHGPVGGMGLRRNAQGLDLNRDHTKLESPEAQALVAALDAYDPDVIIDLHTTNGTQHGYHLTYAPPLHPNTDARLDAILRDDWLPTVVERVNARHGIASYYYGNAFPPEGPNRGWRTFDHRPRFNNNYAGLRNRFGILIEAYSYATFEERVLATLWFVEELLTFAVENATRLQATVEAVDETSVVGQRLVVRAEPRRSERPVPIVMGETVEESHPVTGLPMLRRTSSSRIEEMYEYGRFEGTAFETAPGTYYLPASLGSVVRLLEMHGIQVETLDEDLQATVEEFVIAASSENGREFEGHRERRLEGEWRAVDRELPAGTVSVNVDQRLGRLAFTLLEPLSDDGVVNWNLMDEAISGARAYPIHRLMPPSASEAVTGRSP